MTMMNYNAVADIHTKFNSLLGLVYSLLEKLVGYEVGDDVGDIIREIKKILRSEGANV
ncbi:hypothetical protein LCGC14_0225150 [marine sediment metagenome]|uniref:Uncharacterized protein n=1 Tax=marine sediment metagenome TaxID=412755 RepID=A0A0F9WX15_9ZZZZ